MPNLDSTGRHRIMLRYGLAVALSVGAIGPASAQQPTSPSGLLKVVFTRARTFAAESDFPDSTLGLAIDRAANRVTLRAPESNLTVMAGPEDNMMSFRIADLANPEIVIPRGAKVTLTIVNVDDDMNHDFQVSSMAPPYPETPVLGRDAVGTESLPPHKDGKPFNASTLVVQATQAGHGFYLCTVRGHAKAGMFGKLTVQ